MEQVVHDKLLLMDFTAADWCDFRVLSCWDFSRVRIRFRKFNVVESVTTCCRFPECSF